ncbi:MAG: hypothetical protein D3923_01020 [Candidatus Electrothrix sp. AR3]|nr:hypothetical protein [Candidatus Electrothrix sp. AR3]
MDDTVVDGAFIASLKRNNREIRDDRAAAIAEDTELVYKRKIEDLEISIRKMRREQENMLDLSPASTQSLILASDFNCEEYVAKDIELGIKIRNTEITLEIAQNRYQHLFGGQ